MSKSDKRKYPRLKNANVSIKVTSGDVDIITKTLDISASGIYCKVENEIPLLSRIKIILIVPKPGRSKDTSKTVKIETEGVVVREHPVIENEKISHYDVAIFFDHISAKDRQVLKECISARASEDK